VRNLVLFMGEVEELPRDFVCFASLVVRRTQSFGVNCDVGFCVRNVTPLAPTPPHYANATSVLVS
jgi:hypothetical protein